MSVFYDAMLADRAIGQLMRVALADSGLSSLEYAIYSALRNDPGTTATALAAEMHAPLTTMADWLAKPIRRGHIERTRSPDDGRAWALRLTADGEAAHERGRASFSAAYVRYLCLPGVDVEAQAAALRAMREGALAVARELEEGERISGEIGEGERIGGEIG